MKVIIIGNSAAGLSALEAFRKIDTVSEVRVVTKESPVHIHGSNFPII